MSTSLSDVLVFFLGYLWVLVDYCDGYSLCVCLCFCLSLFFYLCLPLCLQFFVGCFLVICGSCCIIVMVIVSVSVCLSLFLFPSLSVCLSVYVSLLPCLMFFVFLFRGYLWVFSLPPPPPPPLRSSLHVCVCLIFCIYNNSSGI